MTKYIWITAGLIVLLLVLGFKQAPKEPPVERPAEAISEALPEAGEPTVSESGNITVTEPQQNAKVASPLLVKGEARTFEATFQMQLKDAGGKLLAEKTVTYAAEETSEFGSFGELLVFDNPETDSGTLSIFSHSPEDGSVQNLVEIPVAFE